MNVGKLVSERRLPGVVHTIDRDPDALHRPGTVFEISGALTHVKACIRSAWAKRRGAAAPDDSNPLTLHLPGTNQGSRGTALRSSCAHPLAFARVRVGTGIGEWASISRGTL